MSPIQTFDYVVVGGGTAGLVIANRLSENPSVSVGILEAGGHTSENADTLIPGFVSRNLTNPQINWGFPSAPQTSMNDRTIILHRGKAIGGSTAVNFLLSGRGSALEYNAFESLGVKGWNWNEFLKYFKKSETFHFDPKEAEKFGLKDTNSYGTSGPLQRSLGLTTDPVHLKFFDALKELGVPRTPDSSNGTSAGYCISSGTVDPKSGTRSFAATAYYDPIKDRSNLTAITSAHVTKILFEKGPSGQLTAVGVEFSKDGVVQIVKATKEVILCAGTYQTPQILELSGIGDEKILKAHGIPLLHNLPGVGTNLQDHWVTYYTTEVDPSIETLEVLQNPERAAAEWKLYETEKKGLFTSVLSTGFSWLPTKMYTDVKFTAAANGHPPDRDIRNAEAISVKLTKGWIHDDNIPTLELVHLGGWWPLGGLIPESGKRYFTLVVGLAHPLSRGSVHIKSSDAFAAPIIDPKALSNPVDLDLLVEGIKFSRKVAGAKALKGVTTDETLPGANVQSDDELREWVKNSVGNLFHPVGTASMLPEKDGGVVDSECKVYGTTNLRVVDASIMPFEVSAHIQNTVYALAEKGADIIKNAF